MNKNEKTFASNVEAAIAAASGSVKYKSQFDSFEAALEGTKERTKFDPSLSQFVVGTVLDFDPAKMKIGISDIGTNGATVLSVPAGTKGADGKIQFNRAMNVYVSSLGKTIRVHDANGEPVQNADGSQKTVDGAGNAVWDAINACKSDSEILAWLKGKTLEVVKIERNYGPANFVEIGGTRTPKGHRLTSLPLFNEL
jgi:hypothetical protein